MAITKIKAIKTTVKKAVDYITDPKKTDGKLLVSGFNVDPSFADIEFAMTCDLGELVKGDYKEVGNANNLAYHMIQSFAKNEKLTPEEVHQIGRKLADELLEKKHEYVIATHIDKGHIHNHIIFNSTSYVDYKKFRSKPYETAEKIRVISDKLCEEKGLYVIENPRNKGKSYKEWQENEKGTSWKQRIKDVIDNTVVEVDSYDSFVKKLNEEGVEVREGNNIAFKLNGQKRYVNGKTMGVEYTQEEIDIAIGRERK